MAFMAIQPMKKTLEWHYEFHDSPLIMDLIGVIVKNVKNMKPSSASKKILLVVGDLASFSAALVLAIGFRYGRVDSPLFRIHFMPFGGLFVLWIVIFYVYNLYELRFLENSVGFLGLALQAFVLNMLAAIAFFYFNPFVGIAPRTVLFVVMALSATFFGLWRVTFNRLISNNLVRKVALFGASNEIIDVAKELSLRPNLGYRVACLVSDAAPKALPKPLEGTPILGITDFLRSPGAYQANLAVLEKKASENHDNAGSLMSLLEHGMSFLTLPSFIEHVFQKVPLSEISESWFLENLSEGEKEAYSALKRAIDVIGAVVLGVMTLPISFLVSLAIKLEDGRNVFYYQTRVGKNGKVFRLVKFQSMVAEAEADGPRWTTDKDPRVTKLGTFIRRTRIDELPQLWNVLIGDLSFIGPRPERPEFVFQLEKDIPFYSLRHLVRPGLSGWAQINRPLHSVAESYEKMEYDLFYVKNRGPALDTAIALKTLSIILQRKGH